MWNTRRFPREYLTSGFLNEAVPNQGKYAYCCVCLNEDFMFFDWNQYVYMCVLALSDCVFDRVCEYLHISIRMYVLRTHVMRSK